MHQNKLPLNTSQIAKPGSRTALLSSSVKVPLVERQLALKQSNEQKRPIKRNFLPESDDTSQRNDVHLSKTSQPHDHKRRKTDDVAEASGLSTSAPPIRQSTAKKENLPPTKIGGIFSQDTTPGIVQQSHASSQSYTKSNHTQYPVKLASMLPQIEAVKYSHDKLKFGTTTTPSHKQTKLIAGLRESPVYPNPDNIELPEINTEYVVCLRRAFLFSYALI